MLSKKHKVAWNAFRDVCNNFLGNHRVLNFEQLIKKLLKSSETTDENYEFENSFSSVSRGLFSSNCETASDEDINGFHQEIAEIEG